MPDLLARLREVSYFSDITHNDCVFDHLEGAGQSRSQIVPSETQVSSLQMEVETLKTKKQDLERNLKTSEEQIRQLRTSLKIGENVRNTMEKTIKDRTSKLEYVNDENRKLTRSVKNAEEENRNRTTECCNEVESKKASPAQHRLEHLTKDVKREHVEQQVQPTAVQESCREHLPRRDCCRQGRVREVNLYRLTNRRKLQKPDRDADRHECDRESRSVTELSARTLAAQLFRCAAGVIGAKKTYGRFNLASWANQLLAALATNVCLAVRMSVAGHELFIRS